MYQINELGFFRRTMPLGLTLCTMMSPIAQAEYDHCYTGTPPSHAHAAPAEIQQKASGLSLGYQFLPLFYRRACGPLDQRDAQYLDALRISVGCTAESDLGQNYAKILVTPRSEWEGLSDLESVQNDHPIEYSELCLLVAEMPWPVVDNELKPISQEVLEQYKKSQDAIYKKLRHWRETGLVGVK